MCKLKYENGIISNGYETFHCDDESDMKMLCNKINSLFIEISIENGKKTTQLRKKDFIK